ncbi:MAG: MarR family transcriptional regulator [Myxococcales bacterium]|nr:MarR family transcriptional regulator [Myxococcales bacterium]
MQICGCTIEDLRRRSMGPGANPARRFAIWALNRSSELTQGQIAKALGVQYHQVTRLLGRLRNGGHREPLTGWINLWLAREPKKVSSAGV